MVKCGMKTMVGLALILPALGLAQQPCTTGIRIDGCLQTLRASARNDDLVAELVKRFSETAPDTRAASGD